MTNDEPLNSPDANKETDDASKSKPLEEAPLEAETAEGGNAEEASPEAEANVEEIDPENSPKVLRDRWMRAVAELDNFRKRSNREQEAARTRERLRILTSLLEVVDNFERALTAQGGAANDWLDGMEAIYRQLIGLLERYGVTPIDAASEQFDPHRHEAVTTANIPDQPDGKIIEVLLTGYQADDGSIIRPAKVIVVRATNAG